jgi:hypothetical protein
VGTDVPKDLDFSQARTDPDDPTATGYVEKLTVWGEGFLVALEDFKSGWEWRDFEAPGPYGSEWAAHRGQWNDIGRNLSGGGETAFRWSVGVATGTATLAVGVGFAEVGLANSALINPVWGWRGELLGVGNRLTAGTWNRGLWRLGWGAKAARGSPWYHPWHRVLRFAWGERPGTVWHFDILRLYWSWW